MHDPFRRADGRTPRQQRPGAERKLTESGAMIAAVFVSSDRDRILLRGGDGFRGGLRAAVTSPSDVLLAVCWALPSLQRWRAPR
jgi:hypothetical protein